MCQKRSQHPHIAGTGDMNQFCAELFQSFGRDSPITHQEEVERHIVLQADADGAALESRLHTGPSAAQRVSGPA